MFTLTKHFHNWGLVTQTFTHVQHIADLPISIQSLLFICPLELVMVVVLLIDLN